MQIAMTKPLFPWDCLDDSPSIRTIKQFLAAVPDEELLAALRAYRSNGRDDYPVHVLWGTLLLTILLRHATIAACLAELRRNAAVRRLIGMEQEHEVPNKCNMSRFLQVLGRREHLELVEQVFDKMAKRLSEVVPQLGARTAGDSTGLSARRDSTGRNRDGLPQASGVRKEYTDEQGNVVYVVEWFGYKLHVLVDVLHEVVLAYKVSSTKAGDNELLPELVKQSEANLPEVRIKTLAYDKAADDEKVHELLDEHGIKPVIENRSQWKSEFERMLPGHDGTSNIVYDQSGTVYCYDKVSDPPVRRQMAFIGHEPARRTLKYRCPAKHHRFACASMERCNGCQEYGKTVRVKRDIDLRRFPAIPRATKQFERLYKGRSAVERVNARLKVFWGADDGNITGAARFHAFVAAIMVVHMGLATLLAAAPRREGTLGKMHLTPIAKTLRDKLAPPAPS